MTIKNGDDPIPTEIPAEVPQPDAPTEVPDTDAPVEVPDDQPVENDPFDEGNFPL